MHYFQFLPDQGIQADNGHYRRLPTISDKMHCVLFIIDAAIFDEQVDYSVLKRIQKNLGLKSKNYCEYNRFF